MLVPVIGFCGEAQSGKDTAASFLVAELGYERIAFGDPLKEELAEQFFNPTPDWEECLRKHHRWTPWSLDLIDYLTGEDGGGDPLTYINDHKDVFRPYLQLYGTEFRRAVDPDYWVKLAAKRMKYGKRYVFTDVRYQNEADLIHSADGLLCALYRNGAGAKTGLNGHSSECVNALPHDITFHNDGSLDTLRKFALSLANLC